MNLNFIAIGDEVLRGETREGNGAVLADLLQQRGLQLHGTQVIGDDFSSIRQGLLALAVEPTILVISGGLGPTDDDLTRAAVAAAAGVAIARNQGAERTLRERFQALGRTMDPSNLRQADLPVGAELLANRQGTAPGFTMQVGALHLMALPGVPREFAAMLADHLQPWLTRLGLASQPRAEATFRLFGVTESDMQGRLSRLPHYAAATMRSLPTWPEIRLELAARDDLAAFEQLRAEVRADLHRSIYSERRDQSYGVALLEQLRAQNATVAVAESCTGGQIAALLTAEAGASQSVLLGVVAYANAAKTAVLGVSPALLDEHGAVSEPVARAMAEGVRQVADADFAVATSGVAGPDGGTDSKPVGTLCLGLAWRGGSQARTLTLRHMDRARFQRLATFQALEWLRRRLLGVDDRAG